MNGPLQLSACCDLCVLDRTDFGRIWKDWTRWSNLLHRTSNNVLLMVYNSLLLHHQQI